MNNLGKPMIKQIVERLLGIDKIKEEAAQEAAESLRIAREAEEAAQEASKLQKEAEEAKKKAEEEEALAKMSPKERATRKKEPWVAVLDTHINKDNIRNGFFELDWNEYFVLELKRAGYGADGDPDEEIVDRWFRDIVYNMFMEAGIDTGRGAGYINIVPIDKGKSEVS
jgi:hypothetical protein